MQGRTRSADVDKQVCQYHIYPAKLYSDILRNILAQKHFKQLRTFKWSKTREFCQTQRPSTQLVFHVGYDIEYLQPLISQKTNYNVYRLIADFI